MSIFQKHIQDARRRLLYPTRASLDDGPLSEYIIEAIDELITQLGNSNEPHMIQSGVISLSSGQAVYTLDGVAANYGKARYLYTEDDGSTDFQRQIIEIVSLETLTERYRGGDVGSEVIGVPPSSPFPLLPYAAAVYYDATRGNLIEFGPVPREAIDLRLTWEPNVVRATSRRDSGFHLEQFDSLVAAKAALRASAHCQWKSLSRAEAKERRGEVQAMLRYDLGSLAERRGLEYLFWQYRNTSFQKTGLRSAGFGSDRW